MLTLLPVRDSRGLPEEVSQCKFIELNEESGCDENEVMPTKNCTVIKGTLGTFHDIESTEDKMLKADPNLRVYNSPRRRKEAHSVS